MNFMISKVAAVCAVFASVAFVATLTVHAADVFNWTGGQTGAANTEESPYNIWNAANWDATDWGETVPTGDKYLHLSVQKKTYINSTSGNRIGNDFCPNSGDFVFTGPLKFYSFKPGSVANSTVSILKKSGDWDVVIYGMYIGNSSGTKATFVNKSGNINITSNGTPRGVHIGYAAGATGSVENVSGDWSIEGDMYLAETDATMASFVNESGNVTVNNINFGTFNAASGMGTMTIKGGTVTVANEAKFCHGVGTINLDGGTLVTKRIQRYGQNGTLVQNINFDGGTLKASAADADPFIYSPYGYMYVTVNAGGGTIDCNGYPITLDLNTYKNGTNNGFFKGEGGLTFTGGNTITINSPVTYAGVTRVTPGTTLAVANEIAKNNILANGLVVADIPTAGQTVFTYVNALDNADLTKVSCVCAPGTTFKFSDEGKTNIVVDVVGSPDWTKYSHKFRVSFSGYAGSETLENFPVLVKISESGISGFRYADCKRPGGADLRFADASGNLLANEVDTWNTSGESLVWVKVPSLTAATKITAYYGWDLAPVVDSKAVWTGNGYVGVWHLNELGLPLAESSGFSSPFTEGEKPLYVDYGAGGIIGKSVDFSRNYLSNYGSSRLHAADDDGHLSMFTDFTVECWTYQTNYWTDGASASIVSKGEGVYRSWKVYQNHTTLTNALELTEVSGTSTNRLYATSNQGVKTGEWTHQTFVRNKTGLNKCLVYFNGENVGSKDDNRSSIFSNTRPFILGGGGAGGTSRVFPGSIDEVRISNVARSADWVKASHDTVTGSSFAAYGSARKNVDKGLTIIFK